MSLSEKGTPPPPPTEAELDKFRLQQLRSMAEVAQTHYNDPRELARHFSIRGFRVKHDDWEQIQAVRDTVIRLWFGGRRGVA